MSLAKYLRNAILPVSLSEVEKDPLLKRCMENADDLELLSLEDQRHVYRTIMDKNIRFRGLGWIHMTLKMINSDQENVFLCYMHWKKESPKLGRPLDFQAVIAREYLALKPSESVAVYCKKAEERVAFADIYGERVAQKTFGADYATSMEMEM